MPEELAAVSASGAGCGESPAEPIGRRFQRFARALADKPAVCETHREATFGEINATANRAANFLLDARGESEVPVGLLFEHGADAVAAILGTMKAGKICVPLDPSWPADRLRWMLDDAGAAVILAHAKTAAAAREFAGATRQIMRLDDSTSGGSTTDPEQSFAPDRAAYLVYTSGSSGTPKGIVHSHKTALHNIGIYTGQLGISAADRLTGLHSLSFSSSMAEILCSVLNGATLLPWDVRSRGFTGLADHLNRNAVSILNWAPSPYRQFIEVLRGTRGLETPRLLVLGSEAVTRSDWEAYCRFFPDHCRFVNRLGATEVNNYRMFFTDKHTEPQGSSIPGGYAVPGKEVLLVDDAGRPVGVDEVGQIVVRSRYCSPGYWRRPELTAQAYSSDPADPELRSYRTGDLGVLRADGCLEFHGRADRQVKVRGHRIELGEIETALASHETIREAAVVARPGPGGESRLAAFVVARTTDRDRRGLREFLATRLPQYMIPDSFTFLDRMPTTESGKIDRNALPAADESPADLDATYRAPRDAFEQQLADLWARLLAVPRVGIDDDFFLLGGNSILAATLAARIHSSFGIEASPTDLLRTPTIASLAVSLKRQESATSGPDAPSSAAAGISGTTSTSPKHAPAEVGLPVGPVASDGVDLGPFFEFIRADGAGVPLVCIGDGRPIPFVLSKLPADVPVLRLKLDGTHVWPPRYLTLAEQVAIYERILERHCRQRAVALIGYSYGALLAHQLAAALLERRWPLVEVLLIEPGMASRYLPFWPRMGRLLRITFSPQHLRRFGDALTHPLRRPNGESPPIEKPVVEVRWSAMLDHYRRNTESAQLGPLRRRIGLVGSAIYHERFADVWRRIEPGGIDECVVSHEDDHWSCFRQPHADQWLGFFERWYGNVASRATESGAAQQEIEAYDRVR